MKIAVKTIDSDSAGEIDLADAVFGAAGAQGHPARCVVLAAGQAPPAGTHKTKGSGEVDGTTKKMYAQKGTGHARQGTSARRSSAAAARPSARSCAATRSDLPKKVRKLALKTARCRPRRPRAS